ncbi:hypothetical protein [Ilumatobacter sp.]|uniref:hypothetical protein n=1 Tax=Ilumatobacter sp. TaxID=1967498 RepID=UPI003C6F7AE1
MSTDDFVDTWSDRFGDDPPNAILTGSSDGVEQSIGLEISEPSYSVESGSLSFEVSFDGGAPTDETLTDIALVIDSAPQLDYVVSASPESSSTAGAIQDLTVLANREIRAGRSEGSLNLVVTEKVFDDGYEFFNGAGETLRVKISQGGDVLVDASVQSDAKLDGQPSGE